MEQLFWAGLAVSAYLPATVVPTGPDAAGLPIGVQILGPAYGDHVTLDVAEHLEAVGHRFAAPPGW
jgi:amidase